MATLDRLPCIGYCAFISYIWLNARWQSRRSRPIAAVHVPNFYSSRSRSIFKYTPPPWLSLPSSWSGGGESPFLTKPLSLYICICINEHFPLDYLFRCFNAPGGIRILEFLAGRHSNSYEIHRGHDNLQNKNEIKPSFFIPFLVLNSILVVCNIWRFLARKYLFYSVSVEKWYFNFATSFDTTQCYEGRKCRLELFISRVRYCILWRHAAAAAAPPLLDQLSSARGVAAAPRKVPPFNCRKKPHWF